MMIFKIKPNSKRGLLTFTKHRTFNGMFGLTLMQAANALKMLGKALNNLKN